MTYISKADEAHVFRGRMKDYTGETAYPVALKIVSGDVSIWLDASHVRELVDLVLRYWKECSNDGVCLHYVVKGGV